MKNYEENSPDVDIICLARQTSSRLPNKIFFNFFKSYFKKIKTM